MMTSAKYITSKPAPSSVLVRLDLTTKNGVDCVLVRFKIDNADAIKTIILVGDQEYMTIGEVLVVEMTQEFFDSLINGRIEVNYNVNALFPDEQLVVELDNVEMTSKYAFKELEYTFNSFMEDIFK